MLRLRLYIILQIVYANLDFCQRVGILHDFLLFLLETLFFVISCFSDCHDSIFLMLELLLFFLFLKLKILVMGFLLLLQFDVFLMMLQNNLVHGVVLHFLLQFGFVTKNLINLVSLKLLFLECARIMRISLFVGFCNLFLDVIHLVLNVVINNLHVFEISTL